MTKLTRYRSGGCSYCVLDSGDGAERHPNGSYVKYSAAQRLAKENRKLRALLKDCAHQFLLVHNQFGDPPEDSTAWMYKQLCEEAADGKIRQETNTK